MASTTGAHIYTGPWINWSHGPIRGATLTLSRDTGSLLIAFLAVFVGLTGSCFWSILCYLLHQKRAARDAKDAMHHQQQTIFRNNGGPAAAAWEFLRLGWSWRNLAQHPFLRSLPFVLLASLNLTAFGVASIYSSEVTKAPGNESLIRGSLCGHWFTIRDNPDEAEFGYRSKMLSESISADSYARACYNNTINVLECNQYISQQIKWTVNANASCPFDPGRCLMGETAAYEMDTGPIDSHIALGINAREKDRVQYRKRVTCAPIVGRDVARVENMTGNDKGFPGDKFLRYYFGPRGRSNWTYQYNSRSWIDRFDYSLLGIKTLDSATGEGWQPISQLKRTDAQVSLYFLSANEIQYYTPINDPWFSAHEEIKWANLTLWGPDSSVRILGCIDQEQICGATGSQSCTPLGALKLRDIQTLDLNPEQLSTAMRLLLTVERISIPDTINGRGGMALRAQEKVSLGFGQPLPPNQWQIEVSHWMGISMAKLQQETVEWASGPSNLPPAVRVRLPTDISTSGCLMQKVRHTGDHVSFSIVGMAIILVIGGFIILLSLVIDTIGGLLQRFSGKGTHRRLQWIVTEKLHLLRLAYEGAGQGNWSGAKDAVPLTEPGQLFGIPEEVLNARQKGMGVVTTDHGADYPEEKSKNAQSHVTEVSPLVE